MELQEFSDLFDVLYNSIMSNKAPALDEYEKSVFLTKALDEIIKAYFNPAYNKSGEGFDDNPRRQIDFSMLTKVEIMKESSDFLEALFDMRANSKSIKLPDGVLMIINEQCVVTRGTEQDVVLQVTPLQYSEYNMLMSKPFKRPVKALAWRLINTSYTTGSDNTEVGAARNDLIVGPVDKITKYIIRYIKRPRAIVLANLDGVKVGGVSAPLDCELDEILHPEILQRAVELAKAAYQGELDNIIGTGSASATEKGFVPRQLQ